ncbi:hypothetical protein ElyMa_005268700 [Elysia marginata]|uniref:Uncharacterized protein n=1 Tax=Elysia marginata TaxID=1093978 RepID=A0AAV4K2L2_9GAST|nr:hypothetical protein ElyMa_005268700 [Elysia marginata]
MKIVGFEPAKVAGTHRLARRETRNRPLSHPPPNLQTGDLSPRSLTDQSIMLEYETLSSIFITRRTTTTMANYGCITGATIAE